MKLEDLGELSSALLGALDAEQVLQRLGDLLIPRHADQAIIDFLRADGTVRRRIITSRPEDRQYAELLERTAPEVPHPSSPAAAALRGDGPLLVGSIDRDRLLASTPGGPERRAAALALAPVSAVAVAMPGRNGVLGSLTLLTTSALTRRFGPEDVSFVAEIGVRAGLALEGALLHERVVTTGRRMSALQRFTSHLASARMVGEVVRLTIDVGADVLDGHTASVCLLDSVTGQVNLVAQRSMDLGTVQRWQQFALEDQLPACDAIRTRAPVVLRSLADRDERYPVFKDSVTVDRAFVVVPLLLDDDTALGALAVGFSGDDVVLDDDVEEVLLAVGRQCAMALERARLAEAERRAAERQRFLSEASRTLFGSLDLDLTLSGLTRLLVPGVADSASVHLVTRGVLELVTQVHVDPDGQTAMDELHARALRSGSDPTMLEVARTGVSQLGADIPPETWETVADDEAHLAELFRLRLRSGLVVALRSHGRSMGVMTLGRAEGRPAFTPDDLDVLEDLAERAAIAVENALAHAERDAQAKALQRGLLPPRLPEVPGLDLAVAFRPVGQGDVGGDLYDVFLVEGGSGPAWMLVVADVCGKGAEAAAVTALLRWTIRTAAKAQPSPASVLAMCNEVLLDAELGERFATAAVALMTVDPDGTGAWVRLASGGHPLPVHRRLNGDAVPLGESGPLLGIFPDGEWPEAETRIGPGEALIAFTDGLLEARSPSGAFAPHLLEQVLRATVGSGAEVTAAAVLASVDALEQGVPRDDLAFLMAQVPPADAELVHVRVEGTPTAAAIRMDEHFDELLRELELVRLGEGGRSATYPQRVLSVLGGILERFADARAAFRDQAELASFLGRPVFTAEGLLAPITAAALEELQALLVLVSDFSERGDLLTLPEDERAIAATTAWFSEVTRQLRAGTDAGDYRPLHGRALEDRLDPAAVPIGALPELQVRRMMSIRIEQRSDMARVARRFMTEVLIAWGHPLGSEKLDLPLTELVTNAQIHARTAVEVVVIDAEDIVRIEVHDQSAVLPVIRSRERTAGTGRGLALVAALTKAWGIEPTSTGKRAWFDVTVPADAESEPGAP